MTQHNSPGAELGASPVPGLDTLARERLPERDLWAGIEARMQRPVARRRSPLVWPYALAASLSAAVLAGVLLRPVPPQTAAIVAAATAPPALSHSTPYSNENSAASDTAPERASRSLRSESLDNASVMVAERAGNAGLRKATFSKAGTMGAYPHEAILRANLRLATQAEREVRRALRSDPDSEALKNLLSATQAQQLRMTALLLHGQD